MNMINALKTTDGHHLIGRSGETLNPVASLVSGDDVHDLRPRVRTFDIFDTLIARRCITPSLVFTMVEARSGRSGFSDARQKAEANVAAQPHDLDTIYRELAVLLSLDPAEELRLKAMEIAIEREQVIPIAEHMQRVQHGDLLISDMYLETADIRRLLEVAGLRRKAGIFVSNDGKRSGQVWQKVLESVYVEEHLGDNIHSDIHKAKEAGISARHTRVHEPSYIEETFLNINLRPLAELCRETRLRTWSDNGSHRFVQLIQANFNFPLLLLASIDLARHARDLDCRKLLFSSRDCDMWLPLFETVAHAMGVPCTAEYFYTSRLAKMKPSQDYLDYCRDAMDGAMLVDLCGTGWSASHIAARLGLRDLPVYFMHKLPAAAAYEAMCATPDSCRFLSLIGPDHQGVSNTLLEMCNYSDHAMVADVRMMNGVAVPVFARDDRPASVVATIIAQMATFQLAVDHIKHHDLAKVLKLDDSSIKAIAIALYQDLSQQGDLRSIYTESHMEEEISIRRQIGCD